MYILRKIPAVDCRIYSLRNRNLPPLRGSGQRPSNRLLGARSRSAGRIFSGPRKAPTPAKSRAPMLKAIGCRWVLVAHSERRQYFGETNETASKKILAALEAGLTPVYCVGEKLEEREVGKHKPRSGNPVFRRPRGPNHRTIPEDRDRLRTRLGHWHGKCRDARNRCRDAPFHSGSSWCQIWRRRGRSLPHSLWRQREARQYPRAYGSTRHRRRTGGRRESRSCCRSRRS